jgi:anti-sigma regulatory factor (Ser/Thr protein kinase)
MADYIERIEMKLPRHPSAPSRARAEVREAVTGHLAEAEHDAATLLTSELVTNAVIHPSQDAGTSIQLRVFTAEQRLRVEVTDSGAGFDPQRPRLRPTDRGGRGLLLVDQLARRWGAEPSEGGFTVWFELGESA